MNLAANSSHISYRLKENVEILEREDIVVATSPFFQITISHLSHVQRQMLMKMAERACSAQWISETLLKAHGDDALITFYRYLSSLIRHQMIYIYAGNENEKVPLATLIPISSYFQYGWPAIQANQAYRMSRFAYIRRDEDGFNYLESPLSHARMRLDSPGAASIIYQLGTAVTPLELAQTLPEKDIDTVTSLLALLVIGNFGSPTNEGRLREDDDETLMHWDFHDLLFHSRSRMGRHNNMLGGTFRFLHQLPPQSAIKQSQWPVTIPLLRPHEDQLCKVDPTLTAVMEARTSIRNYGNHPITVAQLGEFLYRVARVKEVYNEGDMGDFTKRPYPGGGACYEMELYLTIDQCEGLAPGFYWYDPLHHALALMQQGNKYTEKMLFDAYEAIGGSDHPQVLITLAARFQRVSWKYQSIAYSLILKDVGVIYATMYFVATAMNLAPCALGTGDSDLFTKVSGINYFKETSVGEFVLGSLSLEE